MHRLPCPTGWSLAGRTPTISPSTTSRLSAHPHPQKGQIVWMFLYSIIQLPNTPNLISSVHLLRLAIVAAQNSNLLRAYIQSNRPHPSGSGHRARSKGYQPGRLISHWRQAIQRVVMCMALIRWYMLGNQAPASLALPTMDLPVHRHHRNNRTDIAAAIALDAFAELCCQNSSALPY